jgi:hypothetical protein
MRDLEVEWGQLQLEQSTLAAHVRVEKLARDQARHEAAGAGADHRRRRRCRKVSGDERSSSARSPLLSERLPPWRQRFVLVLLLGPSPC